VLTVTRLAAEEYRLEVSTIGQGQSGVDDCLPYVILGVTCPISVPQPARSLTADERQKVLGLFARVLVHETPPPICGCAEVDPCLLRLVAWDQRTIPVVSCDGESLDSRFADELIQVLEALRS